jgi:Tfp pilus assembly ATPase PilU
MNNEQKKIFKENLELDFSIEIKKYSRFRVNIFHTKNGVAIVLRPISRRIPTCDEINLPN